MNSTILPLGVYRCTWSPGKIGVKNRFHERAGSKRPQRPPLPQCRRGPRRHQLIPWPPQNGDAGLMIRSALTEALDGTHRPLSGRECAEQSSLPYKVAIDALGRTMPASWSASAASTALHGRWRAAPPPCRTTLSAPWRRLGGPAAPSPEASPRPPCTL